MVSLDVKDTEVIWPDKYDAEGKPKHRDRPNLPLQIIERVNSTRATRESDKGGAQTSLFEIWAGNEGNTFDSGWKNKLIWGDNKYFLSSLLEKFRGKFKLIYIDPPFATGADINLMIELQSGEKIPKQNSAIEDKAYRDTWGSGLTSYLDMLYDRLLIMKDLLNQNGAIYVHMDWHVGHYVKAILDEIFGIDNFRNEIHVKRIRKNVQEYEEVKRLNVSNDSIYFYAKSDEHRIKQPTVPVKDKEPRWHGFDAAGLRTGMDYELFGHKPPAGGHWRWSKDRAEKAIEDKILRPNPRTGKPEYLVIATESIVGTMWEDISAYSFTTGYTTEKSEKLLSRILEMSSQEGDLVGDFFCGSGTSLAVAEKLRRRWIGGDIRRYAIHVTRKRLLEIEGCKPFETLNLGKYERQVWQDVSFQGKTGQSVIFEYLAFILRLYGAEPISGFQLIHGRKTKALVHIGAVDAPVTISDVVASMKECASARQTELHILGWEWEMGMHDLVEEEARKQGIKLRLLQIPNDVMEPQVNREGDVKFFDLAYVKADVQKHSKSAQIQLQDFVVPNTDLIPADVRDKIKHWSDLIDYWAVDFDFGSTFLNAWQSYRTKQNPKLDLKSMTYEYKSHGMFRVLVKVVDLFGIDSSKLFEIEV